MIMVKIICSRYLVKKQFQHTFKLAEENLEMPARKSNDKHS